MIERTFFLLVILGFCVMWQKADAQITLSKPVLEGPLFSFLGNFEDFLCKLDNIQTNQTILYEWFTEGNLNNPVWHMSAHYKEEGSAPIEAKLSNDGRLICKASVQNNTEINSTFSDWKTFKVYVPVKGADIVSSPFSENYWEGDNLTLQCNITEGTYVVYDWFLNGEQLCSDSSTNKLNITHLSSKDSGKYVCVAKNDINKTLTSRSDERSIFVKEYLSTPEISLQVVKNAEGNFSAYVTCQVTKGSLPITFSLFKNNHVFAQYITESQNTSFVVPIVLDQDMGMVYCQAINGRTPVQSKTLNLTVESVGGAVTMKLEKYIGPDFNVLAVYLICHVERGRFPQYSWFLNNTRLERTGTFYMTYRPDGSTFVVMLTYPASGGVYHCEAVNSFDNTTSLSSPKALISHEAINKIPTEVAAIVFTFFALLICAVLACCLYGVVLRKRQSRIYYFRARDFSEMNSKLDDDDDDDIFELTEDTKEHEYEEGRYYDLDTGSYIEDTEVVQASMLKDSDEDEEEEGPDLFHPFG